MTISKKLLFTATFGLYISFNGLAMESNKPHMSNFNPERDTQAIINIANKEHYHLWDENYSPSAYQDHLLKCHDNPACNVKILQENEKLAGYVMYKRFGLNEGYIEQVAVSDNFRNKGYGKLLTSTALQELHNMDADYTTLFCYKDSAPALNLYEKIGFTKEWEGKNSINDRDMVLLKHTYYPLIHTCISEKLPADICEQPWNF
jgi:ribosomal protein S18 acetylase RimI-like enzyme